MAVATFTDSELRDLALDELARTDKIWCKKHEIRFPAAVGTHRLQVAFALDFEIPVRDSDMDELPDPPPAFAQIEKIDRPDLDLRCATVKITDPVAWLRSEAEHFERELPRKFVMAAAQEYAAGRKDAANRFLAKVSA